MLIAHIDPALVALTNFAENDNDAADNIERLAHWASLVTDDRGPIITRSSYLSDELVLNSAMPISTMISEYINYHGLQEVYSISDVFTIYDTLIERAKTHEEVFGFSVENIENFDINPDIVSDLFPSGLRSIAYRAIADISVARNMDIASKNYSLATQSDLATPISAKISILNWSGVISGSPSGPFSVSSNIPIVRKCSDFSAILNPIDIWRTADRSALLHFSICLRAIELAAASGISLKYENVAKFFIGSDFFQSLIDHQGIGDGSFAKTILDGCTRIVLGDPKEQISELTNKKKEGILRPSDKAPAKRTHLSKKGVGLRLMFWETNAGPEFANIGPKSELEIRPGNSAGRFGP